MCRNVCVVICALKGKKEENGSHLTVIICVQCAAAVEVTDGV